MIPTKLPLSVLVRVLNAALGRHSQAQSRLAQQVGRTISIELGGLHVPLAINYDGSFSLSQLSAEQADVQLTIPARQVQRFPALLSQGQPSADDLLSLVQIRGDAGLANQLAQSFSQLHFDLEAEIARFTGDLVAVRLVATLKQFVAAGQRIAEHTEGNIAEFLGEESGVLVSTNYQHLWSEKCQQLEQRLHQLEQRVDRLSAQSRAKHVTS